LQQGFYVIDREVIKMVENTGKTQESRPEEARHASHPRAMGPFEEMEHMFSGMFPRSRIRPLQWEWPTWAEMTTLTKGSVPKLDIIERDDEVVVRAEVAGVDKKDLEVSVTDNSVTIRGSTKEEHKEDKGDYFRSEITRGEFSRTAALPCDVDGDKARANFTDGILELVMPKIERSKRRTIEVE